VRKQGAPPKAGAEGAGMLELEIRMPPKVSTPKIMRRAGELRQNQTEAEAKLWSRLRAHRMAGVQFRRQHAIGNYIVDFCSPRRKLIIELDGSQHLDQAEYDSERTKYLEAKGYRVLRFWNNQVMNEIDAVLNVIWTEINK
jgi:very-short-patch-repair endonuclease